MFDKVLVSDDLGSSNQGVFTILAKLEVNKFHQVHYCDDAYLQIKKSVKDGEPYDLLITDLTFKKDHRHQKIENGESLIRKLRQEHPDLKIVVYSDEDRYLKVMKLVSDYNIDGYVCKGRKGLEEIYDAIKHLENNKRFISPQALTNPLPEEFIEINDYDIILLNKLSQGLSQKEISLAFISENINPSSRSSIEKRLNKLRIILKANNAIHLITISKDLGLI